MAQPAVPAYLGEDFSQCPPGHRFTLYGEFWDTADQWKKAQSNPKALGTQFGQLPTSASALGDALRARQQSLASVLDSERLAVFDARASAPFVTGTGIEHPLENGMAFLNPYGLPYLPGSSVKGVLRRAAEELADGRWGGSAGWDGDDAVQVLFGRQPPPGSEEHQRGALTFWDVYPACRGLQVDIMNPHHGKYYQGTESPHDAGSPIPIYFLVLPPGTVFTFHVQCHERLLPAGWPSERWRDLLSAAFDHACDWVGFGAKTAIGYGALRRDRSRERAEEERRAEAERRRAEEQAERDRRAAQAREAARRQAEYDALPESRRRMMPLENELANYHTLSEVAQRSQRERVKAEANALATTAAKWADAGEREQAARLLEQVYDTVGWHEPGAKKDKRAKQEGKGRDIIKTVRQGRA